VREKSPSAEDLPVALVATEVLMMIHMHRAAHSNERGAVTAASGNGHLHTHQEVSYGGATYGVVPAQRYLRPVHIQAMQTKLFSLHRTAIGDGGSASNTSLFALISAIRPELTLPDVEAQRNQDSAGTRVGVAALRPTSDIRPVQIAVAGAKKAMQYERSLVTRIVAWLPDFVLACTLTQNVRCMQPP
jgi:hypothetical protein